MTGRGTVRGVLLVGALVVSLAGGAYWLRSGALTGDPLTMAVSTLLALTPTIWWAIGVVILLRASVPRIGWLLVATAVLGAIAVAAWAALTAAGFSPAGTTSSGAVAVPFLLLTAAYGPWFATLLLATMVLFPDGHLPSARWRLPVAAAVGAIAVSTVARLVDPGPLGPGLPANPVGVDALAWLPFGALAALDPLGIAALALLGIGCLVARFRRGTRTVRQQLKWVVAAVAPAAIATPVSFFEPNNTTTSVADLVQIVSITVLMPASIAVAVTRYRLYDIDRLISRTLGWALVSGILAAVFVASVVGLQALLAGLTQGSTLAVAGSTLLAAALFGPVRARAQRLVDRRFDRARYDHERLLERFATTIRGEIDLDAVETTVTGIARDAIRPTSVRLWLRTGSSVTMSERPQGRMAS